MSSYHHGTVPRRPARTSAAISSRPRSLHTAPSYGAHSPYSTYGGTASGYGALSLPGSSSLHHSSSPTSSYLTNLIHSSSYGSRPGSPSYSSSPSYSPTSSLYPSTLAASYSNPYSSSQPSTKYASSTTPRISAQLPMRSSSFNRHSNPVTSNLGSRANSTSSLAGSIKSNASEGYVSGSERSGRSSRVSSSSSLVDDSRVTAPVTENGEVDYKKLYEDSRAENARLKETLHKTEDDLQEAKSIADKSNLAASKNSLSEMEKRERRAMERKLSEMEEELKQLQKLKAENERLRAENRALTRVVSKLTTSASIGK